MCSGRHLCECLTDSLDYYKDYCGDYCGDYWGDFYRDFCNAIRHPYFYSLYGNYYSDDDYDNYDDKEIIIINGRKVFIDDVEDLL
jgi:hypothetical protein